METLQPLVFCLSDKSWFQTQMKMSVKQTWASGPLLSCASTPGLQDTAENLILKYSVYTALHFLLYIGVSSSIFQKLQYFPWLIKGCEKVIKFCICSYKCKWKYRTPPPILPHMDLLLNSPTLIPWCTKDHGVTIWESIALHQVRLILTSVVYLMFKWPALSRSKAEWYQEHQHIDSDQL